MSSPYADLDRPPLASRALAAAVARTPEQGRLWREIRVVRETVSTNADLAAAAAAGAAEGLVLVAEHQTGGRGRLDRTWVSPPRAGLTFSMLLRPAVPAAARPLLPLLVAAAAARGVTEQTEIEVRLKWPNDLVVDDQKVAGVLAESVGSAIVVGIGLNVSTRRAELPRADATSLQLVSDAPVDRQRVLMAILRATAADYHRWVAAGGGGDAVLPAYRELCATLGRRVRVDLPGGAVVEGDVVAVDDTGRLVVEAGGERSALSAGDVVHLRPAG